MILLASLMVPVAPGWGQPQPAGCRQNKQRLVCDRAAFQKTFAAAKTASIATQPVDRMAAGQLANSVTGLGKTVQPSGSPADLVFVVSRASTEGITIGPAGAELATLRIYAAGQAGDASPQGRRGELLWSEAYTGQPDMPWPAIVHALLEQFQSGLVGKP